MKLNKAYRRWIASMLAAVLVCLQLATAAYACEPQAAASEAAMSAMTDCEAMSSLDAEQPQLCKAHCDREKQSVNNVSAPDVVSAAALDWLLTHISLWLPAKDGEMLPAVVTAHTGPPLGAPPVYLAFQVFRT